VRVLRGVLAGLFVALATPALAQITCAAPQKMMLDVELLLGRAGSDARWKQFLAREVTPRFPDGLTVYETSGQWRDPASKAITREKSRVLRIIVPINVSVSDTVEAIAQAYKKQFRQKSVGIVTRPVCAVF
jgi:Protein of unknown function (DUF3574)